MWEKLTTIERFFTIIVIMGSIVDIFQFSWIIKNQYVAFKQKIYKEIRKNYIVSIIDKQEQSKKDDFPGIK